MKDQECTLNIQHDAPKEVWVQMDALYKSVEGWKGYGDGQKGEQGIPYWFSFNENETHILASVEPSGLQFLGLMEDDKWEKWIQDFKDEASRLLGYQVLEIEVEIHKQSEVNE